MKTNFFAFVLGMLFFTGLVFAASGSIVSTTTDASPFWTNSTTNPVNVTLTSGNSTLVTFWVKATGLERTIYNFFGFGNLSSDLSNSVVSSIFNVTIVDTIAPLISFITSNNTQTSNSSILVEANVTDASQTMMFLNDSSLVGYWNAENGAVDSSSYSNDGTFNGNANNNSVGKFGSAYGFDGNSDYISVPDNTFFNTNDISLSIWVKRNRINHVEEFLTRFNSGTAGQFNLYYASDNLINLDIPWVKEDIVIGSTPVTDGLWHNIIYTRSINSHSIYLDGVLDGSSIDSTSFVYSGNLLIGGGADSAQYSQYFNGSIDEVMIFNRSLSQSEISALYNATAQKFNATVNLVSGNNSFNLVAKDTSANVASKLLTVEKVDSTKYFTFSVETNVTANNFSFQSDNAGNLTINWGDGNVESVNGTRLNNHTYASVGYHNISLNGYATRISFYEGTPTQLRDILTNMSDGLTGINSGYRMLRNCNNITTFSESHFFDVVSENVTNLGEMFYNAVRFNQNLTSWNTHKVTDMQSMFYGTTNFNGNISNWNTSKVADMYAMFQQATSFNQSIDNWDISSVIRTAGMFQLATSFNQPLNSWNTSKVTQMQSMFQSATNFNQNLSNWDTSKVTNMNSMFQNAVNFNQPLNSWNTSKLTSAESVFYGATAFNQPLNNWDTSKVTSMYMMFGSASNFNQNLSNWNTSSVDTIYRMFYAATSFNGNVSTWDVSKVTSMQEMFRSATAFNQSLSSWNVSKVTNMVNMFYNAVKFNQNLSSWNVSSLTTASQMFTGVDLSVANYDSLLNGWTTNLLKNNTIFSGGSSKYSINALSARNTTLIGTYNWSITDGGMYVETVKPTLVLSNYSGYDNVSVTLQINASDEYGIKGFALNDSSKFSINNSGFITNSSQLQATSYFLNVSVNDSYDNIGSGIVKLEILASCVENLTNSTPSDWVNQTECRINDTILQNRSFVEYDSSVCGFSNLTYWEYQEIACDYCTPSLVNTSWSDWTNISCLFDNTMNQSRNKTEYDSNSCGEVANVTYTEYQNTESCQYDTVAPVFTFVPENLTVNNSVDFSVDFNGTDAVSSVFYSVNDSRFVIDNNGTLKNNSLLENGTYFLNVSIRDDSLNYNSTIYVLNVLDVIAPEISVTGYSISSSAATYTWTTNKLANSTIYYGTDENVSLIVGSSGLTLSHSLTISGLSASTLYYYNISSCDNYGNCVVLNQSNFTTTAVSSGTSSGGGGGGSIRVTINASLVQNETEEIKVSPAIIELPNVAVGVLTYKKILIENIGSKDLDVVISLVNLSNLVNFEETSFVLGVNSTKELEFSVVPSKDIGSYSGKIVVSYNDKKFEVPVIIVIKSEKSLFDINLYIPDEQKSIYSGDKLSTQISLIQAGLISKEDVTLNYEIKDFDGNVYLRESETVMVEDQKQFIKEFQTQDLPIGDYVLNAEVVYSGGIAPSSSHFSVKAKAGVIENYGLFAIALVFALVIVSLTWLIIRYKKEIMLYRNR